MPTAPRRNPGKFEQLRHYFRGHRVLAVVLLVCLCLAALAGLATAYSAYKQFSSAKAAAQSGAHYLALAQSVMKDELYHPTIPSSATLAKVKYELTKAH